MNINWKVRFKNKVWLAAFATVIISTVYQVLAMFEITPKIPQDTIMGIIMRLIDFAAIIGIVIDPTTKGIEDSERAMTYEEPN